MQQVDHKLPFKLIYSLGEHPYLGYLLEPHIVQLNTNGSYSLSYKRIFTNTVGDFASALDDTDRQIIKLLDEIEQTHIIKTFNKKAIRPRDFFGKIFDEKIYDRIRPKIEQKMLTVLKQLTDKPLFLMSKDGYPADQEIQIADEPTSILFHFRRNETETRYFPTLKYKGQRLDFMYKNAQVVVNKQAWLLLENTLHYFEQDIDGKKLSPFLNKRYISVPRTTEKRYFETFVSVLIDKHHVYDEWFDIKTHKENARPVIKFFYMPMGQSFLQLSFVYGPYEFAAGTDHPVTVRLAYQEDSDQYVFHRIKRSLAWEKKQEVYLEKLGLRKKDLLFGNYIVAQEGAALIDWLNA